MTDRIMLEWRRRGDCGPAGCSATVRDAAEAARIVGGMAAASVGGEYRLSRDGHPPVYASAAGVRAWAEVGGAMPAPIPSSLWRRECERAGALEELTGALRSLLGAAARRGLLPQACVAAVVRMVERAATDPQSLGDASHGPLSR